ncbi:MAG: leucyl aminopeptidase [Deltaproteobacteria bacterium]|nr:leucyl aminopeptidase [Deltaproteobacteria bacterium]
MLKLQSVDLRKAKVETLAVPVCEDSDIHADGILSSVIAKALKFKEFKAKKNDELILFDLAGINVERVLLIGLGKLEKIDLETLRAMAGNIVKKCIRKHLSQVAIAVPTEKIKPDTPSVLTAMLEGAALGNHLFEKYKKEKKQTSLKKISLLVEPGTARKYAKLPSRVKTICEGAVIARNWVSMPPNDKTPRLFAKSIASLARKENLKVLVLNEKTLKQKRFGAIQAVAAGSQNSPRMVVLEYKPRGAGKSLVLVGKGVTFDSGGINLKPSAGLDIMKSDMSGAAAVAATLVTIARLKPKIKVVGVIPIVENMPSGNASEGRLILIDAISYAVKKYKPETLIDMATLTGACVVALGEKIAGVFSFDDALAEAIVLSGEKTHERCWRMPLPEDYKEMLKSDFADMSNIGNTRFGGAITAALFLSEFVGDTRWAHIDIAGPAYIKKENAYCNAGGTGFGVRLLCDLIDNLV